MFHESTVPIAGEALAPHERGDAPIRILIADDHPAFRDGLGELLDLEDGLNVVAKVSDGSAVAAEIERLRPDIVLLDLMMPQLDGLGVLLTLREHGIAARVILLTASEDRDHLARAMQLGASGVVLKSDRTEVLIKSIRRVHAGEIWLHASTTEAMMQRSDAPRAQDERRSMAALLTRKEREVVRLVAQGLRNKEIGARLFITEQTVKNHLRSVFEKLQVSDRLELALYVIHHFPEE